MLGLFIGAQLLGSHLHQVAFHKLGFPASELIGQHAKADIFKACDLIGPFHGQVLLQGQREVVLCWP